MFGIDREFIAISITDYIAKKDYGEPLEVGLSLEDLRVISTYFEEVELVPLGDKFPTKPHILIARGGLGRLVDPMDLYREVAELTWDGGRMTAVHTLAWEANGEKSEILESCVNELSRIIGAAGLSVEARRFYKEKKASASYRSFDRRRIEIGIRLGRTHEVVFRWFHSGKMLDNFASVTLGHGDIYFISSIPSGTQYNLRYAEGINLAKYKKIVRPKITF